MHRIPESEESYTAAATSSTPAAACLSASLAAASATFHGLCTTQPPSPRPTAKTPAPHATHACSRCIPRSASHRALAAIAVPDSSWVAFTEFKLFWAAASWALPRVLVPHICFAHVLAGWQAPMRHHALSACINQLQLLSWKCSILMEPS